MNLRDLERSTRAAFAADPEGFERAWALVEMAWNAGLRSAAARPARRNVRWEEWSWDEVTQADILRYVHAKADPRLFPNPGDAAAFVAEQMERAQQWATSKGEKRENWTALMKGWLGRRLEQMGRRLPPLQAGLFVATSANSASTSSTRSSQRREERKETAMRLLRKDGSSDAPRE